MKASGRWRKKEEEEGNGKRHEHHSVGADPVDFGVKLTL
jgi:hypothetical protein